MVSNTRVARNSRHTRNMRTGNKSRDAGNSVVSNTWVARNSRYSRNMRTGNKRRDTSNNRWLATHSLPAIADRHS